MLKKAERLAGVNPDLVKVVRGAANRLPFDLLVVEGLRTKERQAQYVKVGASRTMNSYHLTGHAVDLAPWLLFEDVDGDGKDDDGLTGLRWDWPLFHVIAKAMKEEAKLLGVPLTWGGDWKSFKDGPHFQIKR